jgi:hypothetical protein
MFKIILRREAIALGLATYFNGKPCPRGHMANRSTMSGRCRVCIRAKSARDYARDPRRHIARVRARQLAMKAARKVSLNND